MQNIEKRYDNKLTVFMSAISVDCSDKIVENTKHTISIYEKQSKTISKLESTIQKQINSIEARIPTHADNIPKWIDLDHAVFNPLI